MIPKMIHYCWFGGAPFSDLAQKCLESWKRYCPDYEIVCWNETNFDLNYNDYVREAYNAGKWAFVSDVVRLYALFDYGGIYMDTDVELIKPLDELRSFEAVFGFESESSIQTALMMCRKGHPMFAQLLHDYDSAYFVKEDGRLDTTTNVTRITNICKKYGLRLDNTIQNVNGVTVFPWEYFCPKNYETNELRITNNTYAIHHFDGSWISEKDRLVQELTRGYRKHLPRVIAGYLAQFIAVKKISGFGAAMQYVEEWLRRKIRMGTDTRAKE